MSEITITVTGRAEAELAPERATVWLSVHFDGATPEPPLRSATELAQRLSDDLRARHDPASGPVTSWSSDQLRTWSARPWSPDGIQLPLLHYAAINIQAQFSDFDALSLWLGSNAELTGVSIGSIDWTLRDETRERVVSELRTRAVEDAIAIARTYAAAIGRSEVVPQSLTEGDEGSSPRFASMKAQGVGPDVEFTPAPVRVEAQVQVRFAAN